MSDKKSKKDNQISKGELVSRIILALFVTSAMVYGLYTLIHYMIYQQHTVETDADFMERIWDIKGHLNDGETVSTILDKHNGMLWTVIVAWCCNNLNVHPLVFCYSQLPVLFLIVFVVEYICLSLRFMAVQKRGGYFVFAGTCLFMALFSMIIFFGGYSSLAIEGGVILNPWYGRVVAGILGTPPVIYSLLGMVSRIRKIFEVRAEKKRTGASDNKEKSGEITDDESAEEGQMVSEKVRPYRFERTVLLISDIFFLLVGIVIYIVAFSIEGWNAVGSLPEETGLTELYKEYFEANWMLVFAVIFIVMGIVFKVRGTWAVIFTLIICTIFMIPLPVGLIFALAGTLFVMSGDKLGIWQIVASVIMGGLVVGMGMLSGRPVTKCTEFKDVENRFHISSEALEVCEAFGNKGNDARIVTTEDFVEDLKLYDPWINYTVMSEETVSTYDSMFRFARIFGDYVVIPRYGEDTEGSGQSENNESSSDNASSVGVPDSVLINMEFCLDEKLKSANIYRRTRWVDVGQGWAHEGLDGMYLKEGWYLIQDAFYHINGGNTMDTGWITIDEETFYLGDSGKMSTGWQEIDGKWYYFLDSGIMLSDVTVDGYYLGPDGALQEN